MTDDLRARVRKLAEARLAKKARGERVPPIAVQVRQEFAPTHRVDSRFRYADVNRAGNKDK